MISFLHPGFLYAAGAAAAAVVALHFLVAEQPRAGMLPTARFFPDVEVRSTTLTLRLSDIMLLLLRVLTLLLIGAAFAQPQLEQARAAARTIVLLDQSRSAGPDAGDSAAKYLPGAAAVIVFDSVAVESTPPDAAARSGAAGVRRRGSLSSALIVALRSATRMRDGADSLEMVLVSPLRAEELDSATPAIRALWPGRIRLVRVAAMLDTNPALAAATVEWADSSRLPQWSALAKMDTIGCLSYSGGVFVYPFVRRWVQARTDSSARVVARWVDGEPAIVESPVAPGCVRSISVPIPTAGDAILRPAFARFLETLRAPCGEVENVAPASDADIRMIEGPAHLAPTASLRPVSARMTPLVPWL
ncbi:MAG: BatA domain-containing protein, partial [Gemmatimonadota bacterium]|nr:BatA domain-containing protein [Gemmatimonadota bacterium]